MFFGKEAIMTIRITLYANTFMHNDVKHMSVSIMLWTGKDICGSVEVAGYVKSDSEVFMKAMDVARLVDQQKCLLEALHLTVELDEVFKTTMSIHDTLLELYGEVL
jgi:hypothetical protein